MPIEMQERTDSRTTQGELGRVMERMFEDAYNKSQAQDGKSISRDDQGGSPSTGNKTEAIADSVVIPKIPGYDTK
jgi:hypothetical protein